MPTPSPIPDRIHILCAADRGYGPWLGIMAASVLSIDHGLPVTFHVLSNGISPRDQKRLARLCEDRGAGLRIYDTQRILASEANTFFISLHFSRTVYSRIFLDRLVDPDVSRLIYLDCDIACVGSLRELWETDLGDSIVAAVPDFTLTTKDGGRVSRERLGIPDEQPYYNSGMLLIDLDRWRKERVGERMKDFIVSMGDKLGWLDQDALNRVLGANIKKLAPKWNFQAGRQWRADGSEAVIHYIGSRKPWDLDNGNPLAFHYLRAKAASPWKWTLRFPMKIRRLPNSYRKRVRKLRAKLGLPA